MTNHWKALAGLAPTLVYQRGLLSIGRGTLPTDCTTCKRAGSKST